MSDKVIRSYSQASYVTLIDAESVTSSFVNDPVLRQRVQISVKDVTTGTPTEIGDAANQAVRVNVVQGTIQSSSNVTITALGVNFPTVTVSGISTGNTTITGWTYPNAITITGTVTGLAASSNVTVTGWTYGSPVTITGTVTGISVTAVNVTVSQWTAQQPVTVSVATWTAGTLTAYYAVPVTVTGTIPSNTAVTTPTGASVQVVRSLAELLPSIQVPISFTAATASVLAGVSGKRIWLTGYHVVVGGSTNITWQDTAGNNLSGAMPFAANSGATVYGTIDAPVFFVATPGNGLIVRQSGSVAVAGAATILQF